MSPTSYPTSITGHAVVKTKAGNTYVGHCAYDGRAVTIDGSLRVIETDSVVSYRKRRTRTIAFTAVKEILWDDDASPRP